MSQQQSGFDLNQLQAQSPPPTPQPGPPGVPTLPDTANKIPASGIGAFDNTMYHGQQNVVAGRKDPELAKLAPSATAQVQTPEEALDMTDENRDYDAEIADLQRRKADRDRRRAEGGVISLDLGDTVLTEDTRIQGPNDRVPRPPTDKELERSRFTQRQRELVQTGTHTPRDPEIDKNAPKDVPADPRQVAESRGMKFDVPEDRPTDNRSRSGQLVSPP